METTTGRYSSPELAFLDPRGRNAPYEVYAALREDPPLRKSALGYWISARYAECVAILRDKRFVASSAAMSTAASELETDQDEPIQAAHSPVLPFLPTDQHDLVRHLLHPYFSKHAVLARSSSINDLVHEVLADALRDRSFDLVQDVADPLARRAIAAITGLTIRPEDSARWDFALSRTPDAVIGDAGQGRRPVEAIRALEQIVRDTLDEEDLGGGTVLQGLREAVSSDVLSEDLAVANAAFLVAAGHETTMTWMTNTIFCLLRERDNWEAACAERLPVSAAVEEALRLETPVQVTTRVAKVPLFIAGADISARDAVWLLMGSANRDERVYSNPTTFDPGRSGPRPLAFGGGAYYCSGALMATCEVEAIVSSLARQLPNLRLSSTLQPEWNKSVMMRSLRHLWVER